MSKNHTHIRVWKRTKKLINAALKTLNKGVKKESAKETTASVVHQALVSYARHRSKLKKEPKVWTATNTPSN